MNSSEGRRVLMRREQQSHAAVRSRWATVARDGGWPKSRSCVYEQSPLTADAAGNGAGTRLPAGSSTSSCCRVRSHANGSRRCHSSAQRVCGWRSRRDAGRRRDSAGRAPDLRRGLILADVLRTKLVGTAMKALAEVLDSVNIRTDRGLGEVATLQLLNHELRRWVTGDLLPCDQS